MPLAVVFQKDFFGSELGKLTASASPSDMVCTRGTDMKTSLALNRKNRFQLQRNAKKDVSVKVSLSW